MAEKRKPDEPALSEPKTRRSASSKATLLKATVHPEFFYMKIKLTFEDSHKLDELYFKNTIFEALRSAFGLVGAGHQVDLLSFDEQTQSGLLRVPYESSKTVRTALSLFRTVDERRLGKFDVLDGSAHLASLAASSRDWDPQP
ncbi:uncharacterized protein BJ171DRAFT_71529 [Polychytrium aggregatum]|uniref:uncharacterized protein n=1 Tax=Polychytrium aggregatum TaxID=110093 RepID=UPI0022FEC89E|nr:uncharacterized protein BJ171DRAFT_71529 [Polychytrium aggregatum]KAI9205305.1 hypothetical protein BJ171DRAFT_71529 [Polychytrium aggregatum]